MTYGGRVADMWWQQNQAAFLRQDNLTIINLPAEQSRALAALAEHYQALRELKAAVQEAPHG